MPAMIDYSKHRKAVGVVSSVLIILIQAIQIGTVQRTWLAMTMLHSIGAFLVEAMTMVAYAYLPEMSYRLDESTMTEFTSKFVMSQFAAQALFLVLISVLSVAFGLLDKPVEASRVSQAINAVFGGVFFYYSWKSLESVPPRRVLAEGKSLLTEGFVQIATTIKKINKSYRKGTKWYFLALMFSEAAASAFTTLAVVYHGDHLGFSFLIIGLFFLVTLIFSLPGALLGHYVTNKLDPKRSWRLVMVLLFFWVCIGPLSLDAAPEDAILILAFAWMIGIGIFIGWYYPNKDLFFSMCLPVGQEAELAGLYVYCTQILGWLNPLIFAIMVEAEISQTYAILVVGSFFLIGAGLLSFAATWPEILEECRPTMIVAQKTRSQNPQT